jgi:hypothetical protein
MPAFLRAGEPGTTPEEERLMPVDFAALNHPTIVKYSLRRRISDIKEGP